MASISFRADTGQVREASLRLAGLLNKTDALTAYAMTQGVKAAKRGIEKDIFPLIEGGPTQWTKRGLIVRFARSRDLRAQVGFNYGGGEFEATFFSRKEGGTPSGRYMSVNVSGGERRAKSVEEQFRQRGIIGKNSFLVPNRNLKEIDKYGNLPGPIWQQVASRVGGFAREGSTQNAPAGPGSRGRTARKRRQVDFFILKDRRGPSAAMLKKATAEAGGDARLARFMLGGQQRNLFIAKRVGRDGRGYEPFLWIVENLNYSRKFPVQVVAWREFSATFPVAFERELEAAMMRRLERSR